MYFSAQEDEIKIFLTFSSYFLNSEHLFKKFLSLS